MWSCSGARYSSSRCVRSPSVARDGNQDLLREALSVPQAERADVVTQLLASLDNPTSEESDVHAAWAAEIERRARRVIAGETQGIPWEDVRRRAIQELDHG